MDLAKLIATLDAINSTSTVVEADAKKDEKVDEEDTQENKKFSGELAKAREAGKKDFEVDGKKYQVKESEDESDDEDDKETVEETEDEDDKKDTQDLEECYSQAMGQEQPEESGMSINASTDTRTGHKSLSVTAQGQAAEQLAQLLKLSGLSGGAAAQAQPEMGMEEAYANEPNPETQSVEVQLAQGTDLNRPKTMHKHSYRQGDNPMAMREAQELAEIEQRLNEELAAFKVVAEGDIDEGVADNLKKAAAAGILGLGLAAGGTQAVKDYNTSQDVRQTQQQAPTVKIGSKNYKVFSQDLASKGEYFARKVGSALKDKIIVTDGSGNQFYLGVSSNNGHNYRLLPTSQTNVNSPTATVGNKQMSVISPTDYEKGFGQKAVFDKMLVKDNSGNSYYLQVTSNTGHNMWLVPVKNVKEGVAEGKGKKPDFLDMDKDGDRKEPMKKALADKSKKKVSETVVAEKAVSQQQQKFMGMVHAMQKGEKVKGTSPELKKAAKGMSKKAAKDYASTKHKGLPKKVKESIELTEADLQSLIKKFGMAAVTAAALAGLGGTAQAQTTPSYQAKPAAVQQAVSPEYQAKLDKKFNAMYASNPAFKEEVKNLPSLAGYHNVRSPFSLHVHKASNSDKINLLKKFKALPESVSESRTTLQEADLQSLIKKFGMAAVTAAALAGLGGTAQARPNIDDPGSYKVPVPISAPAQQQQSSELQDLAQYGVKAVKDLGNDFTQVRFQDRDGVFDGHSNQIYFYSSKTDGLEKVKIKDGRMTTDYTSASDIGPMTRAAFQKAGIPILQGGGINIGNKSPADGAVRPYFASQSQPGSPKPKSATIAQ